MKIVIDIPEEEYNLCKRQYDTECLDTLMIAVKYGTPLPKGHGRLIDADEIIKQVNNMADELDNDYTIADIERVGTLLKSISTFIEADNKYRTGSNETQTNEIVYDVGGHMYGAMGGDVIMDILAGKGKE